MNVGQAFILKDFINRVLDGLTQKEISKFYVTSKGKDKEPQKESSEEDKRKVRLGLLLKKN